MFSSTLTNFGRYQEQLEKKKAQYAEKMKNQIGLLHKQADEKRALIQAERGQELLKAEEAAAKYRATGGIPKKFLGCFWNITESGFWKQSL